MALKAHLEPIPAGAQRRRHPRRTLRLETSGSLPDGIEANVTVHNLSAAGLLIETELPLETGDVLAIDMPQIGPVGAEIVWRSQSLHGCAFQQALGEAALAAAQLASGLPVTDESGAPIARGAPRALPGGEGAGNALGARLHRLRRERGLTLAQVAEALDVSKPTVWAWEKGKARPLPERMDAIAEVLGIDPRELEEPSGAAHGPAVIEECRLRIASAYGTSPDHVRIMIEL